MLRRATTLIGVSVIGGYCADTTINDDWDSWKDMFRTKISAEERMKHPRKKLVILGTGWGGLNLVRKLHCDKYDVTIVSPRNYFLFTPLLAGSTVGTVSTSSILEPIRKYCHRSDAEEVRYIQAECFDINPETRKIECRDVSDVKSSEVQEFSLDYDELVVAVGARVNTFGIEGVSENALFMKEIEHASKIRNRIIDCFETANIPGQSESEIERLLHFAVVGGGPSGIEFAASLHDFLDDDMREAYPDLTKHVHVTIVEAMDGILRAFDPGLVKYTEGELQREKIDLWTNTFVSKVGPKSFDVKRKGEKEKKNVPCGMVVWVAGIGTRSVVSGLAKSIGQENGQNSRRGLIVNEFMQVKGAPHIWALGDCAVSGLPPTAQVAAQQGSYLGRLLNNVSSNIHGHDDHDNYEEITKSQSPFDYKHKGIFAYTGDGHAICQVSTWRNDIKGTGSKAYALWASVYWSKLLSMTNRACVGLDWFKTKAMGRDITRR